MARLKQIVIDCRHPAGLARFWAAALDEFAIRPYDDAEIKRLSALGFTPETDPTVLVDGPNLELCFQRIDLPPATTKRPLHFDIEVAAIRFDSEIERLVGLGAEVVERFDSHVWLRDPEGNDFCVTERHPPT